jgi:hypothetical protein
MQYSPVAHVFAAHGYGPVRLTPPSPAVEPSVAASVDASPPPDVPPHAAIKATADNTLKKALMVDPVRIKPTPPSLW